MKRQKLYRRLTGVAAMPSLTSPTTSKPAQLDQRRSKVESRGKDLRWMTIMAVCLWAICLASGAFASTGGVTTEKSQQIKDAATAPQGLNGPEWASVRRQIAERERAAVPVKGGYQANNSGQQWRTTFDKRGFLVKPDSGDWSWGLELKRFGLSGQTREVATVPRVTSAGSRVAYDWTDSVQEWFVNDTSGLEHGLTIGARPAGGGEQLELLFGVRGGLRPLVTADGKDVRFLDKQGSCVLTYSGLKVLDAGGKPVAATFTVATDGLRLQVADRGVRYPLTIDPLAQQAYVKASDTTALDNFGFAVAISGNTLVVGAKNRTTYTGVAYVFVRNNGVWTQQATLTASNAGINDRFGRAVAISGDTIVIGASGEGSNGTQSDNSIPTSGAAYVFVRDSGGLWSQQAYLKASNVAASGSGAGTQFGFSVAISGDTVVVGANWEDSNGTGVEGSQSYTSLVSNSGAAYVFVRSNGAWTQQAYLKASNAEAGDQFGYSVAISGDSVVVGAWFEDSNATGVNGTELNNSAYNSGAAYVFVRSNGVWSKQAYLKASNTKTLDQFGYSVAISGETIVVGANLESSSGAGVNGTQDSYTAFNSGAAYVFVRSNGTDWSQQAYLKASNTGASDQFGLSVAISVDAIVVGALNEGSSATGVNGTESDNGALTYGAAYVFSRSGTVWSQTNYLKASNTKAADNFGCAVGISGNTVAVGAYLEDSNATGVNGTPSNYTSAVDSGAVYLFFAKSDTATALSSTINPTTVGASVKFTAAVTPSTATGSVTFMDGVTTLGTAVTLSGGSASYDATALSVGDHIITAVYAGDSDYNGSTSPAITQKVVDKATPLVVFNTVPTPTYLGGNFTVSATTTNTDSTTLTYSKVSGPCTFVSGGTFSSTGAGTCVVQADGVATTNFNAVSKTQNVTIAAATPVVTVTPGTYTYSGSAQGPGATETTTGGSTGALTFSYLGTGTTTYTASATKPTAAGTYSVTATVVADINHNYTAASSSATAFSIGKATPIVTVTPGTYTYSGSAQGPGATETTKGSSTGALTFSYLGTGSTTYPASSIKPTSAGSYSVTATASTDTNYAAASSFATAFSIAKATPTVTVTPGTYTYSGSAQGPGATETTKGSSTGALTFSYLGTGSTTYTASSTKPTTAGTYSVTATAATDTNYFAASSVATAFSITKATPTVTVTPGTYTYSGLAQGPGATDTTSGSSTGALTFSYLGTGSTTYTASSIKPTSSGTYSVTATAATDTNYAAASSVATAFSIAKATPTVTVTPGTYTYSGSAQGPGATETTKGDSPGALTFSYQGTGSTTYTASSTKPTAAGTYSVTATAATDTNYAAASSVATAFSIAKATPTVTVTPGTYTYSGSAQGPGATETTSGSSSGALTFSYQGTGTTTYTASSIKPTSAGTYSVTASAATDTNYAAASSSATAFSIGKATTTVTVTPGTYTYSGSAQGPGATETTKGDSPGALTFSYLGTGSTTYSASATKPTTAGAYSVTATVAADSNYAAASSDATAFTIAKATATVALSNLTQNYSGSSLTPTAVTNPVGLTIDWTNAPQTNAGSYTVTATINSNNYQGSNSGEFVITKVTPTLSITTTQQSYDGASHGATITASVDGSVTNIKYNGISTVPFTAGTYTVTADFTPTNSSYNSLTGASAGNFTIARAIPTLAVANSPLIYTGSAKGVIVTGNIPGGVSGVTYNGSSTQPINAGSYEVKVNFAPADSTNYGPLTNAPTGSFTIAKATPTLAVTNSPVRFDGSGHAATVTGSVAGSVDSILTGSAATQSAVGTYAVTANFTPTDSNYSPLTNASAGNFAILAINKVSVTIQTVPAGLTVTVDGGAAQIAPYTFTATPGLNYTIATTSPQGTVGTRYLFAAWSDGSKVISRPITAPNSGSATYTATFTTEYQLTTAVSPVGSGTVIPATNGWYAAGSTPSIIATAGIGYGFSAWSGPAGNASSSATSVIMSGPVTVTATMKPLMTILSAAIGVKSGDIGVTRTWPIILTPSAGSSAAAVQITGMTVSSSGTCKPVVTSLFPLNLGDIAAGNTATGNVTVDFRSCSAAKLKTIKFNVNIGFSANNGASTGSTSLTGVGQ